MTAKKITISEDVSILEPVGYQNGSCGYCSAPGTRSSQRTNRSVGVEAIRLTCDHYQAMVDRGWRRSGTYVYKPDLRRSCCPQYTIRLDATQFEPTRSHRKIVNRWNRYVIYGTGEDDTMNGPHKGKQPTKTKPFSLIEAIHASESSPDATHQFTISLEPSSYSEEKFQLYASYQRNIHNDYRENPEGFSRFLVDSPLERSPIIYRGARPDHLPEQYGSYHQLYRIDGKLIAMAVLDILPGCVSSVYFMYDVEWEKFSLGKLSALREASLAIEMVDHGVSGVQYLYMGFYIHSCQKMRYKGDYHPSFLLDPEDYSWHSTKLCFPLLERHAYACFAHPGHSLSDTVEQPLLPLVELPEEDLKQVKCFDMIEGEKIVTSSLYWRSRPHKEAILRAIEGLGQEVSKKVLFVFINS